ncbi:MAG: substrate-binding domain-containing protein, partial [bacterium]|nr:substrate-binding domain-containing protein [bacterium]
GSAQAAKDLGIEISWLGTEREDQRAKQIAIVDSQVINQMDGIVLAPLDGQALLKPVKEAVQKKIPVVIMDSALVDGDPWITSFVATDNFAGGELAGRALAENLNQRGNVIMLRHQEGSASTGKREEGFLQALKQFPNIRVLSAEQYGGRDPQKAAENLLHRFLQGEKTPIHGIFCPNLTTTYGMMQALRRARLAGKIQLVGFDSDASLVQGLEAGEIHGLVLQDPFQIGYRGVQTMVQHLRGKKVEDRVDTPLILVTSKNLKDPKVQTLLQTP